MTVTVTWMQPLDEFDLTGKARLRLTYPEGSVDLWFEKGKGHATVTEGSVECRMSAKVVAHCLDAAYLLRNSAFDDTQLRKDVTGQLHGYVLSSVARLVDRHPDWNHVPELLASAGLDGARDDWHVWRSYDYDCRNDKVD